MKVKVYGKLNLSLNVYERQGQFHPIDSVLTSVDIFDVVRVQLRQDKGISVICNDVDIPALQNSAYRAAVEFQRAFNTCGCAISIEKGIPVGAGMGGSSADAAAVIYCLCRLHKVDLISRQVEEICSKIGSDVSFMLFGGFGRITGKGDYVQCFNLSQPLYFALTTFDTPMNTGEVYQAFDNLQKSAETFADNRLLVSQLRTGTCHNALPRFSNMLQPAALSLSNYASEYLQFCNKHNIPTTMTGSGSAFYVAAATKSQANIIKKLLISKGFNACVCKAVPHGIKKTIL